jgi:hypothetical protein
VDRVRGTQCEVAILHALESAHEIVAGELAPIEGAKRIADFGTRDCYEYLHSGIDVIDSMAEFFAFVHDWELRQDSEGARAEIALAITQAARTFSKRFT